MRVIIVGGGTAGWMAAAALAKTFGERLEIELVESEAIGTVGVGEATIPAIKHFHLLLELDEAEFLRAVRGTFKLGIEFRNWGELGERYFHPFGPPGVDSWAAQFHHYWLRARRAGLVSALEDYSLESSMAWAGKFSTTQERKPNYAYHFDAGRYAAMLRSFAEARGVRRTEGRVDEVATDNGRIESIRLESGRRMAGDLFVDCTGFRALLIGEALDSAWEDWSEWLPNDRAVAVQTESDAPPAPHTLATARGCGWQWKIPLKHRVGNGLVYSSRFLSDDEARKNLLDNLDGPSLTEPRLIRFRTGRRFEQWKGNCVALGLSSGFLEPLESTSIHLIQNSIIRLIKLFPVNHVDPAEVAQFNREVRLEFEQIRDFIILHYHATRRADTAYWIHCRDMSIPETLAHKLRLFRATAKIVREQNELFAERSWAAVMLGQGIVPDDYHPVVDTMSDAELTDLVSRIKNGVAAMVSCMTPHEDYLGGIFRSSGADA